MNNINQYLLPSAVYVPKRVNVAIMLFMICLVNYMMRVNLSINIIAMVEERYDNGTIVEKPDVCINNINMVIRIQFNEIPV